MTLLIATDEAGYGPRLGPLVIAATAWRLQPDKTLATAHRRLARPINIGSVGELRIDDSKRLFVRRKPKQPQTAAVAQASPVPCVLDLLSDAAATWAAMPPPSADYRQWLLSAAADDLTELCQQPWFAPLACREAGELTSPAPEHSDGPANCTEISQALIRHWSGGGLQLVGIAMRIVDAPRFNRLLDQLGNKAELLSHMTCELALALRGRHLASGCDTYIYSDRHGGRAYYGGLLQHHCSDLTMRVISETSHCSVYRLSDHAVAAPEAAQGAIHWSFTVGGDSYPPVALSSIIAKSTRERLMGFFNDYFQLQAGEHDAYRACPLRPTAGYAADATRFLCDIDHIRASRNLQDAVLIRRS